MVREARGSDEFEELAVCSAKLALVVSNDIVWSLPEVPGRVSRRAAGGLQARYGTSWFARAATQQGAVRSVDRVSRARRVDVMMESPTRGAS